MESQTSLLLDLAKKRFSLGDRVGGLDELEGALNQARRVGDGQTRSGALREIGLAFYEVGEAQWAEKVLFEAVEALNKAERFRFTPTPWSKLPEYFAKIGRWDFAEKITRGLASHDAFDGATGFRNLARVARDAGHLDRAESLFAEAKALAPAISFPPIRADLQSTLAEELAVWGRFDEALAFVVDIPAMQLEAIGRIAEQIAKAGRPEDALALVEKTKGDPKPVRGLRAIVTAFLEEGKIHQALVEVSSSLFKQGKEQEALKLIREVRALARTISEARFASQSLEEVTARLVEAGQLAEAVSAVQEEWRRAATRRELLDRLPMARSVVSLAPDISRGIYASLGWVEGFLQEV